MLTERKKAGKALSASAEKVRRHLATLSPEALEKMTRKIYMRRTHHVDCSAGVFGMEKTRAKRLVDLTFKKIAPRKTREDIFRQLSSKHIPMPVIPSSTGHFEILATIELAPYGTMGVGLLRTFTEELLAQVLPKGARVQVRMLADPEAMEIRRPV